MLKQLKSQKGFTLIELMIVVAIIGILAAIAIPNFLTYQMKSRQSEAKTNLQAIRTSQIAFQAERGCYLGVTAEPVAMAVPAALTKSVPVAWGIGVAPVGALDFCLAGGTFVGTFRDVGFVATGNVNYLYTADSVAAAAVPIVPVESCVTAIAPASAGADPQTSFVAAAQANLDADDAGATAGVSVWGSTNDHGATDCTIGQF